MYLINNPDYIEKILSSSNFKKGPRLQTAKRIVGEGLVTSEGEFHKKQRKLIQPLFLPKKISSDNSLCVTEADLVNFPGSHYVDSVLNWRQPVGITDLEFLSSTQLGPTYNNNLFVGDINNGNLYYFTLNEGRNGFELVDPGLSDLIVDNSQELDSITLGGGFGGITDVLTGPDGLLYVLSYGDGVIYKITQSP